MYMYMCTTCTCTCSTHVHVHVYYYYYMYLYTTCNIQYYMYMCIHAHVRTYELCFKAHVQSLEKVSMLVSMVTHITYLLGSVECDIANERMMKAMKSSVSETPSVMRLFVVDCKNNHDITFLNVPILPSIAVKSEGVWIGINEDISVITYIKSIQQYSM